MIRKAIMLGSFVFLLVIFASLQVAAQSTFGSFVGVVKDKSGSVIPGVALTLTDLDKNTTRQAESDERGSYQFLNVLAGRYSLVGEHAGFAKVQVPELQLQPRQEERVDLTMDVGTVVQSVQVQAQAPQLNTESATISNTATFISVIALPANYRGATTSPLGAIVGLPGVQQDNSGNISVGGGVTTQATEYSLDGISNEAITTNGAFPNMYPSTEMLSNFQVASVNNNAEYGGVGVVLITTKSGANQLHGSAFEYFQNAALDAVTYGSTVKQAKNWNTFGGSLSGPVYIPKLYDGRNKTFFFVDYEGNRRPGSQLQQDSVPTAAMRAGNLAGVPGGAAIDPTTGVSFPNNTIPSGRINPVAVNVLSHIPLPNTTGIGGGIANDYVIQTPLQNSTNGVDFRIDEYLSDKHQIFGRFSTKSIPQTVPLVFLPNETIDETDRSLVLSDNYTFSRTLLNEARFGFSRLNTKQQFPVTEAQAIASYGLIGEPATNNLGDGGYPGFSFSDGTNFSCIGEANFQTSGAVAANRCGSPKVANLTSGTYDLNDTFSWIKGAHTFKFGIDYARVYYTAPTTFNGGDDDTGLFTFSQGAFTGNAYADFLLGIPFSSTIAATGPDLDQFANHWAGFAQDEFRVTSKLTLTFGLRYEVLPPYGEAKGNLTTMAPGNNSPTASTANEMIVVPDKTPPPLPGFLFGINACPGGLYGPATPFTTALPCTPVVSASSVGLPQTLRFTDWYDIDPRLGIAWRPFGDSTVFRAGIGKFTTTNQGNFANINSSLHTSDTRTYQNFVPGQAPLFTLPHVSNGAFNPSSVGTENLLSGVDTHDLDPQSIQYNVTVAHEFPNNYAARLSYIGMNTYSLTVQINLNEVPPSKTPYNKLNTPFPNWGPTVLSNSSLGFGNYQGLEGQLTHSMASGFSVQATYDYARNISNVADSPGTIIGDYGQSTLEDRFDTRYSRGNTSGTRRQRFLFSGIYQLPFGKGRAFMGNSGSVVNGVLGGWQASTITLLETGPYGTVTVGRSFGQANTAAGGGGGNRPDIIGNPNVHTNGSIWNPKAFALVPQGAGRLGDEGVGVVEGPGTIAVATGLAKEFPVHLVHENGTIRFEATFTNALNHPNFAMPATVLTTPSTFGIETKVQGSENAGNRSGQLSLRFAF